MGGGKEGAKLSNGSVVSFSLPLFDSTSFERKEEGFFRITRRERKACIREISNGEKYIAGEGGREGRGCESRCENVEHGNLNYFDKTMASGQ